MKVTTIQESADMSTLTLDSLYTKLKTHEMNILSRKIDSKSSALVSPSTSFDIGVSPSNSTALALINAMFDEQLEQFEEDLALAANKISRATNNIRYRRRVGPARCFECGALDHIRSHCSKLGRGKKEDNDGDKTKDDKPKFKSTFQGRRTKENIKKMLNQIYADFESLSDVDGESEEDEAKNISGVCLMSRGESDLEYDDNEALVVRKENVWIVDSGCSRHMTGDKNWFSSLRQASKTESIIFGDASTSAVLATGTLSQIQGENGPIFEDESDDNDKVGSVG
ncbi:uncharacterized protein LOC102710252 [Oryza brachyantha]|uniref:uncharacterized protein LOC102710252 n=1 Tax=Oryza brachyantha TaxID=4533 RepID=UPI001ADBDC4C|nr:uncharacterized protein LOC102710252 [Oryza brachyantha]